MRKSIKFLLVIIIGVMSTSITFSVNRSRNKSTVPSFDKLVASIGQRKLTTKLKNVVKKGPINLGTNTNLPSSTQGKTTKFKIAVKKKKRRPIYNLGINTNWSESKQGKTHIGRIKKNNETTIDELKTENKLPNKCPECVDPTLNMTQPEKKKRTYSLKDLLN